MDKLNAGGSMKYYDDVYMDIIRAEIMKHLIRTFQAFV